MREITPVVKQLLIINILFFVGTLLLNERAYDLLSLYYFEGPKFRFWQPFTHMFMHGGIAHIAFNMFALFSFGSALEHYWGGKRFLFFYITCGLGAALVHMGVTYYEFNALLHNVSHLNLSGLELEKMLNINKADFNAQGELINSSLNAIVNRVKCDQGDFNLLMEASSKFNSSAVGASGAIYGLLIAFAFMFPDAILAMYFIPIPIKAKYFVPIIVGFDLFSGVTGYSIFGGGNIAHFAHVGGALFGFLLMLYWRNNKFNHKRWN
jgi:membrane associated rhomboid family serine protease